MQSTQLAVCLSVSLRLTDGDCTLRQKTDMQIEGYV